MDVIYVQKDKVRCGEDMIESYVNALNGIIYVLDQYGYVEGNRNTIIVDMTVASYMLGIDPYFMLDRLKSYLFIRDCNDDELPIGRVNKVMDYTKRFDWDWMIDADTFSEFGWKNEDQLFIIKVEVED